MTAVKRSRETIGIYCKTKKDGKDAWVLQRPGEEENHTFESEQQLLDNVKNPYSGSLVAPWLQTRELKGLFFYDPVPVSGWKCMELQQIATDIGVLRGCEPRGEMVTMGFIALETRHDATPPRLALHRLGGETSFHENFEALAEHFKFGKESPEIPPVEPINDYLKLGTFYEALRHKDAEPCIQPNGSMRVWVGKSLLHPIEAYADLCEPDLEKDGSIYGGGEEARTRLGELIGLSPKDAVVVTRASSGMTDYAAIEQARLALESLVATPRGPSRDRADEKEPRSAPRRMEIVPKGHSLEPAFRELAKHQSAHYVERWPLLAMPAALDQPKEIAACRAMAITNDGAILIIRDAQPDEKPATEAARRGSYERSLRVESAVREKIGDTQALPVRIHVLTTGTDDRYLDQSGQKTGCNTRCDTADQNTVEHWHAKIGEGKGNAQVSIRKVWQALTPDMPIAQAQRRIEAVLAFAIGNKQQLDPHFDKRLAGEALALRTAIRAAHAANASDLENPSVAKGSKTLHRAAAQALNRLEKEGLYAPPPKESKARESTRNTR